ncbi:MAG: CoA-binding protein [Gammaproteobacteria bacterium]|nr:CoA-binding protein [Gammaproteobacteria bacterium]
MTENKALAILGWVKRIAMVGASADPSKASYRVLKDLTARGYEVIPVNPRPDLTDIDGIKVYPTLKDIEQPIDMVDVFRPPAELPAIARQAIDINAKVLWMQLGIKNTEAEEMARAAGLEVIMDRCPSIELAK